MRILRGLVLVLGGLAAVLLAACGSSEAPSTWTLKGTTGSVTVTAAATAAEAPKIEVTTPFAVAQTEVHVLTEGSGATVQEGGNVLVNYVGVNGRTGQQFDSSYTRGAPASFSLSEVIPGFAKALAGQRVGSTVAVAVAPADGYTQGAPAVGIEAGDTLVFALTIADAPN